MTTDSTSAEEPKPMDPERLDFAREIERGVDMEEHWSALLAAHDFHSARADNAEANYRFMVKCAADEKLDGDRELGQRAADAERERDDARAVVSRITSDLHRIADAAGWPVQTPVEDPGELVEAVAELRRRAADAERERDDARKKLAISEAAIDSAMEQVSETMPEFCRLERALDTALAEVARLRPRVQVEAEDVEQAGVDEMAAEAPPDEGLLYRLPVGVDRGPAREARAGVDPSRLMVTFALPDSDEPASTHGTGTRDWMDVGNGMFAKISQTMDTKSTLDGDGPRTIQAWPDVQTAPSVGDVVVLRAVGVDDEGLGRVRARVWRTQNWLTVLLDRVGHGDGEPSDAS